MHCRATIITSDGQRVRLDAVCPSRADMDAIIDGAYPNARMVSIIVRRTAC